MCHCKLCRYNWCINTLNLWAFSQDQLDPSFTSQFYSRFLPPNLLYLILFSFFSGNQEEEDKNNDDKDQDDTVNSNHDNEDQDDIVDSNDDNAEDEESDVGEHNL